MGSQGTGRLGEGSARKQWASARLPSSPPGPLIREGHEGRGIPGAGQGGKFRFGDVCQVSRSSLAYTCKEVSFQELRIIFYFLLSW